MENLICQSCGMPLTQPSEFSRDANGAPNKDYCCYCYKDGSFTQNTTMKEMIEHCCKFLDEFNKDSNTSFSKEEAVREMKQYFPSLKRWKI